MNLRDVGKFWLPVFVWMALIFLASTDMGSMQHTSRVIEPLLRFFWPNISAESVHNVQLAARKTLHVSGYAVLAVLLWRALQRGFFVKGWSCKSARIAGVVAVLYAISDEWHQSFVPTRGASVWDVVIDAVGALLGLCVIWVMGKRRGKW